MRADAESSCPESRTDSWSLDAARNPWSAPTTELWAPTPATRPSRRTVSSINASKPNLDITVPASNNPPSATKDPSSNTASNPSIPPATLLTGSASLHGQNDRYFKQHSPTSGGLFGGRANPRSLTASVDSGLSISVVPRAARCGQVAQPLVDEGCVGLAHASHRDASPVVAALSWVRSLKGWSLRDVRWGSQCCIVHSVHRVRSMRCF